ncbi:sensor histidine kinase [Streptococcus suis]
MKTWLKNISDNSLLLWWITLINHFILMIYIYLQIPFDFSSTFTQKFAVVFIILLIISTYICNFLKFKYSELKLWLLLSLFLISWQLALNLNVEHTLFHFLDLLHPINSFLLVYSSVSIILLGKKIGEELFFVTFIVIIITEISYFFSKPLFLFLSIFTSFFISYLPIILLMMYKKELKSFLNYQRKNLTFLSFFLPVTYIILYINTTDIGILNFLWYVEILLVLVAFHLKTIYMSFQKKIDELKLLYIEASLKVLLGVSILLVTTFIIVRLDLKQSFICFNLLVLIVGFLTEEFIRLFRGKRLTGAKDYLEVLFLKRNKMVKNLLTNEDIEQQFAEFLHNEVLQSVMAIKNFNKYGEDEKFRTQIGYVSDELVQRIRERMDYYQPMSSGNEELTKKYTSLIDRILRRYETMKKVETDFQSDFFLMEPYDKILYRFIEELVTNAVKYSSGHIISLSLSVSDDIIYLSCKNDYDISSNHLGYGLKNLENRVSVLGGTIEIQTMDAMFQVEIQLPIDKELCYENFIN